VPGQQRASAQTLVTVRWPCATALKTTDVMMHLGAWGQTETEHTRCGTTSEAWSGHEGGRTAAHRPGENTHWPRPHGTCGGSGLPSRRATRTDGPAAMIYTNYRRVRTRSSLHPCSDPAPHTLSLATQISQPRASQERAARPAQQQDGPTAAPRQGLAQRVAKRRALRRLPLARTPASGLCMPHHSPPAPAGPRARCRRPRGITALLDPGRCCQTGAHQRARPSQRQAD